MYKPSVKLPWDVTSNFLFTRSFWVKILFLNLSLPISSYIFQAIVVQNSLGNSGISGFSLALFYYTGFPIGIAYFLFNIPIFIIGYKIFDMEYIAVNIIGTLLFSIWVDLLSGVPPVQTGSPLVAVIAAGIGTGIFMALYMKFNAAAGGLDIIAAVVKRKYAVPMGVTFNLVNAFNILLIYMIYDIDRAVYSGIYMFLTAKTIDFILTGFSQRKALLIITSEPDKIAEAIGNYLDRGTTFIRGIGAHSKADTKIVFTIINMVELGRLKEIIYKTEPNALICVFNTSEVIGKKFLSWEQQGYKKKK